MCVHFSSCTALIIEHVHILATTSWNGIKCELLSIQEMLDIMHKVDAT
jgi:hypothetical protein